MQIDRKRATIKLTEAGIKVKDQKIAKEDMSKAKEILANYKAEAAASDVQGFLKALGKLRHDDNIGAEVLNQFLAFFRAGNIPEFYVHTLEVYTEAARTAMDTYNAEQAKKMVMIKERIKKDKEA